MNPEQLFDRIRRKRTLLRIARTLEGSLFELQERGQFLSYEVHRAIGATIENRVVHGITVVYEIRRYFQLSLGQRLGSSRKQFRILYDAGGVAMIANATKDNLINIVAKNKPGEPISLDVLMDLDLLEHDIPLNCEKVCAPAHGPVTLLLCGWVILLSFNAGDAL